VPILVDDGLPTPVLVQIDADSEDALIFIGYPPHGVARELRGDAALREPPGPGPGFDVGHAQRVVPTDVPDPVDDPVPLTIIERLLDVRPRGGERVREGPVCVTVSRVVVEGAHGVSLIEEFAPLMDSGSTPQSATKARKLGRGVRLLPDP